jgi:hypothetical protein
MYFEHRPAKRLLVISALLCTGAAQGADIAFERLGVRTENDIVGACTLLTGTAAAVMAKRVKPSELKEAVGLELLSTFSLHRMALSQSADVSEKASIRWATAFDSLAEKDRTHVLLTCTSLGLRLFSGLSKGTQAEIRAEVDEGLKYMARHPPR